MSESLNRVFISHSGTDAELVDGLRTGLEGLGWGAWVDAREMGGGVKLSGEIQAGIEGSAHMVVVLSAVALGSRWVQTEVKAGLEVQGERPEFKVIPILLPPLDVGVLKLLFPEGEPLALSFDPEAQTLDDLLPQLSVAIGAALPRASLPVPQPEAAPLAELVVRLDSPQIDRSGGKWRARALGRLVYVPPVGSGQRRVESKAFGLRAPLGPIEAGELAWYLERFAVWPSAVFRPRAEKVERELESWGRALLEAIDPKVGRAVWEAFRAAPDGIARWISIEVDPDPAESDESESENEGEGEAELVREAATLLLGLPWELLHDDQGYIAAGARGVRVRRRLPFRSSASPLITGTPVRVLVVSPRPEDDSAGYIDHRASARPLVDAFAKLGSRVELELLGTPTLTGLSQALGAAHDAGRPFHVVHFDGHGIYSRERGLGMLCFEDPADANKLEGRRSQLVPADKLAEIMRDHRVPLVVLEACQSAKTDSDPRASVAGRLLQAGVASVIAMSHSVLVETAKRFVAVFYDRLSAGATVGAAMLAAQRGLREDSLRGKSFFGELRLRDWFVPVLYQEQLDPQLVTQVPGQLSAEGILVRAREAVATLPPSPGHGFVGRSRALLKIERLLGRERFATLLGEGGEGKTTIAVELARWLVASRRFVKAAFVSVEDGHARDARAVLASLGAQLVVGFGAKVGGDLELAWQHVERALRERATLVVLDNMESMLAVDELGFEPELLAEVLELARRCSEVGGTRVLFTSRSRLPEPVEGNVVRIGRLEQREAVAIVGQVLERSGEAPADDGDAGDGVEQLVDTAGCHARSLVLLAKEVQLVGVRRTTKGLQELMVEMAARHPDDRERSLFASVELSLRRLPDGTREKLRPLGVFHGGGHGFVIAKVLGLDYTKDEEVALGNQLVEVGLAEWMPYGHLRLHPALGPLLLGEMSEAERGSARAVWVEATVGLVGSLRQQQSKDAQVSAVLTLLELSNLLAVLDALRTAGDAEHIVDVATDLETMLQYLGRPKALARVVAVREEASGQLDAWGHARFVAEQARIDRLLDIGHVAEAAKKAHALVQTVRAAGESAYADAPFDLALALVLLGRALNGGGAAAAALGSLEEAQGRFEELAKVGGASAEGMASLCSTEIAECLIDLGRLDEAASKLEAAITRDEARGDRRDVAIGKFTLGSVRMYQGRYDDALSTQRDARDIFEQLGEPGTVAGAWHQIGMTHEKARQYDTAEHAYQKSLAIRVRLGDRSGEGSTLNQLGGLYLKTRRLEDSARFFRDSVTIDCETGNQESEGTARANLAIALLQLERHDEAREELLTAIDCKKPYGHAAEPWKAFNILTTLERATGNAEAAEATRQQAIDAYLAYRRDGGENHLTSGKLARAVRQAIAAAEVDEQSTELEQLAARPDLPESLRAMVPSLQALLAGSRDPALASNPQLHYSAVAELILLLETLP